MTLTHCLYPGCTKPIPKLAGTFHNRRGCCCEIHGAAWLHLPRELRRELRAKAEAKQEAQAA